jgi:diguanylate cyclase (GGDEF)-like protein
MNNNVVKVRKQWFTAFLFIIIAMSITFTSSANDVHAVNLETINTQPIGLITSYIQEKDQSFTIEQALNHFQQGQFQSATKSVLTFGIGSAPVWIAFSVDNRKQSTQQRRFVVEQPWIDYIDIYVKNRQTGIMTNYHVGDGVPYSERPIKMRNFQVDFNLDPGITDVMLYVKTTDPMTLSMYLRTIQQQTTNETLNQYGYGLVYGYLLALLLFNALFFIGLRDTRYLLYAALLGSFLVANISYTGHGFMWIWPNSVAFQLWAQALFMSLFGIVGLLFSLYFLDIRQKSSYLFRAVLAVIATVIIGYLVTLGFDKPIMAIFIAFLFMSSYIFITMMLGFYALKKGHPYAPYYLAAISFGSLGIAVTAFSAWGLIPFNQLTFHAAELGMLVEATLLALALSAYFRKVEADRIKAEKMAGIDLLTDLNNRRGFFSLLEGVWKHISRHSHAASVIIFDLDSFKKINDAHGHEIGDRALKQVAKKLNQHIRSGDITARWGGEEFVLFLPETNVKEAHQMAERLRKSIAKNLLPVGSDNISVTASFGIAERTVDDDTIEQLIAKADKALFVAKRAGKNRVEIFGHATNGSPA